MLSKVWVHLKDRGGIPHFIKRLPVSRVHNEADNTHKGVILQNQSEAELYKNSLEGESTYINIKNKPVEIFYRKPVLIPSNQSIF